MERSRRSDRFLARTARSVLGGLGWRGRRRERPRRAPARLAALAGADPNMLEQLETRQLLFTLTITPDLIDPLTGVGTITEDFAYFIPYLNTTLERTDEEPETDTEDFNDEDDDALGNLGSPTVFEGSNLQLTHNIPGPQLGRIQLVAAAEDDNEISVSFNPGDRLTFRLATDEDAQFFMPLQEITMVFGGAGIDVSNTVVELLVRGQVVASFTGAALAALGDPTGLGAFTFPAGAAGAFDQINIRHTGDTVRTFTIDDVTWTTRPNNFAAILDSRHFGARVAFTGPVGASVQILDLYGRDLVTDDFIGLVDNIVLGDLNADGVPDINDGIGRIIIDGADARTSLTIFGGTSDEDDGFVLVDSMLGLFDDFEGAGFGYFFDADEGASGLPPGPGSVIIGSPFVRPQGNYNPDGGVPGVGNIATDGFDRAGQGIVVRGGRNMGSVYIHGVVHGNNQFTGAVNRLVFGYLVGSVGVAGDLNTLIVGSDAGYWEGDPGTESDGVEVRTQGQLSVGRTVGEIAIAGRSAMAVTVTGNLNAPTLRPPGQILSYFEKEFSYGFDPATPDGELATIARTLAANDSQALYPLVRGFPSFRDDQALLFADGYYRNDTIMGAEFVGSTATAVQIHGDLGARDPVNPREDDADVFAFAVGEGPVVVEITGGIYARIVDHNGRTLAALQAPRQRILATTLRLDFQPPTPGVYYLVLAAPPANTHAADLSYVATVAGLAPTTLGAHRTGSALGHNGGLSTSISVLSGSLGLLSVATGYVDGGGADADPIVVFNDDEDDVDERQTYMASTVTVAGHLFGVLAGGDIVGGLLDPVRLVVGRDLGILSTGLSPVVGTGPSEGDVGALSLQVGRRIAMIDIKGAIGLDQDSPTFPLAFFGTISSFRTGTSGQPGDIGVFRVGSHIAGGSLSIVTSPGSTVGAFLVSQDIEYALDDDLIGIYLGGTGIDMRLGFGSNIRFVDVPRIDLINSVDARIPLIGGESVQVVDDAGERITIEVIGAPDGAFVGSVVVIPIDGSQGVAVGQIQVDLTGGRRLQITGSGLPGSTDAFTIGRIILTGADAASSIGIVGNDEIDVWRIDQLGGAAFSDILNSTPGGDIVAIDVVGLTRLDIRAGDLGRTQMPGWGPSRLGPFLGLAGGAGGAVGGAIGINAGLVDPDWNGGLYRPANDGNFDAGQAFLDDVGFPVDPFLDGLIVRTGNIDEVTVGGAIGDVIAAAGNIIRVTANADRTTTPGRFEGIIGNIYAAGGGGNGNITRVDIGDGLARSDGGPLSSTGILAEDDIETILNDPALPGAFIASIITAGNVETTGGGPIDNGIFSITLVGGGDIVDAYISASNLDRFWLGFLYGDDNVNTGRIDSITGQNADLLRSEVAGGTIGTIRLVDGFFDASLVTATAGIGRVEAAGFRNSTIGGTDQEYHLNQIISGGNLDVLTTTGRAGDIVDLLVDVLGSVTTEISARNLTRVDLDVDNRIQLLLAGNDVRGSRITAGELVRATVARNIRSSIFNIAGPITLVEVGDSVLNTTINATGPNGRLVELRAVNALDGTFAGAHSIGRITTENGDITGEIRTGGGVGAGTGNVTLVQAGRDLDVDTDIAGTVDRLIAGRHIGHRSDTTDVIHIRGDVRLIEAGGQIYTDINIGGDVTENIRLGRAVHKPGFSNLGTPTITAFGRIERFDTEGDFGGRLISHSGGIRIVRINNGSFLPGGLIAAYDGNLDFVVINKGNLYGDLHADRILRFITVNGSNDGVFGDIGVNHAFSSGTFSDEFRNQLPPGVTADPTLQGPRITAGHNLGRITVTNGTIFEAFIYAGRAIGSILVTGGIRNDNVTSGIGTLIAAGSLINTIAVTGNVSNTLILAGPLDFGADGLPGGTDADADTVNTARIINIDIGGDAVNLAVSAGMHHGPDGVYNTADDRVAPGRSWIRRFRVDGDRTNVSAFTDMPTRDISSGIVRGGASAPNLDPDIHPGNPVGVRVPENAAGLRFTWQGRAGTITFSGPGEAYWDAATGRVIVLHGTHDSVLRVTPDDGVLNDFDIVTNDEASIGTVIVAGRLTGDSDIVIDGFSLLVQVGGFSGTGDIRAGMNIRRLVTGPFTSTGAIEARYIRDVEINGDFGATDRPNEEGDDSRLSVLGAGNIAIGGTMAGVINVDRFFEFNAGRVERGNIRAGESILSFNAGSVSESHVSANDRIGSINVVNDVFDSSFIAGGDLGADATFNGPDANRATSGGIGDVTIGGDFVESDLVAGLLRGPDGFFGTDDDAIAAGRSDIGRIVIRGSQVGSNLNSEQYRIAATGQIGPVTVAGAPFTGAGNFRVANLQTQPMPILVREIDVRPDAGVHQAFIQFNQAMDASTIGPALTLWEVRDNGLVLIRLQEGLDYTVDYDAALDAAVITFSDTVMSRDLEADGTRGTEAGPGVYRFQLDASVLRAAVVDARLDGNGDGAAAEGDNFVAHRVVGDAGDKFLGSPNQGERVDDGEGNIIDFYPPADLDLVLDGLADPDLLPDANTSVRLRGVIGDHPDNNTSSFRAPGDVDVYQITLQAGQILRLGAMEGSASLAARLLFNADGEPQFGETADSLTMFTNSPDLLELAFEDAWLIKTTGVYYLVVGNGFAFNFPGFIPNPDLEPGTVGDYTFTVEVFDDGNTGFAADTDAGNGDPVVQAPHPNQFAGPDGQFGTADDRTTIIIGDFTFRLEDGVVTGSNGRGITSVRLPDGRQIATIESAIGPEGHRGVPADNIAPDVDVYHLNGGQRLLPGNRFRITVKLADSGADLGRRRQSRLSIEDLFVSPDFSGSVQLGIFDTTNATNISDALLVLSPSDFQPVAGEPGILADDGATSYGFDDNGDFFVEFVTPGRLGASGSASYAVYLQGVFNTDYTLEIVRDGQQATERRTQNILIETRGGTIDWLEVAGQVTELDAFRASDLGLTGTINSQPVQQYIIDRLIANLTAIFNAAGVDVRISTNPADFEFEDYSTVFLTSTFDPVNPINQLIYGASEHSDPFNADRNDEAVVFAPSLSVLGADPTQEGVDLFTDSLTAAVGRRVGELVGLRLTGPDFDDLEVDVMSSSSVDFPGSFLRFANMPRRLSGPFDNAVYTNFFLGEQHAIQLLDKYLLD